ncbi:MAG TPA: glucose 1-dehydrogenase [Prolixibacteraceae bacterium]|nr:glucose 1-dehydrogenase [Prolixibacteraceae bacterium]
MKENVVVITGAGKGIGKTIARVFAQEDYRVVIAEKDPVSGEKTAKEITSTKGRAVFIQTDVSKVGDLENLMRETVARFGEIDVLINNAGLSEFQDPLSLSEENWDRVLDTNLKGVFFASREAAKYMKEQGGSIVNIASTRALMSEPGSEAYAASKGGILSLTHALAASFSTLKITVNAVLPGWIETADYSRLTDRDHRQHFSGRVGKPDDIARACLFLSNPENRFITGAQLVVDGGMTRKMMYEE